MTLRPALAALLLATLAQAPAYAVVEPTEPSIRSSFERLQAAMDRDDSKVALPLAGECLEAARKTGSIPLIAEALLMHGEVYLGLDKDKEAKGYLLNALGLAVEVGDRRVHANALNDLGIVSERDGGVNGAESYYREALGIAETLDDPLLLDAASFDLGSLECDRGDYKTGYARLQQVLDRSRGRKDDLNAGKVMIRLANVEREMGKADDAASTAAEALGIGRALGYYPTQQGALRVLAMLAMDKKDFVHAEGRLKEALGVAQESRDDWSLAYASLDLGQFYASKHRSKEAVAQLITAQRTFRRLGKQEAVEGIRKMLNQLEGGKQL